MEGMRGYLEIMGRLRAFWSIRGVPGRYVSLSSSCWRSIVSYVILTRQHADPMGKC